MEDRIDPVEPIKPGRILGLFLLIGFLFFLLFAVGCCHNGRELRIMYRPIPPAMKHAHHWTAPTEPTPEPFATEPLPVIPGITTPSPQGFDAAPAAPVTPKPEPADPVPADEDPKSGITTTLSGGWYVPKE